MVSANTAIIRHMKSVFPPAPLKILVPILTCLVLFSFTGHSQTEQLSLDKGWQFYQGDIPFPVIKGHNITYNNAKAGSASGAAAPGFDDKTWRTLDLPHDWAVENPFDTSANLSQGYRQRGIGWYRRHFKLSAADRGKYLELQFGGIATHATIWLNGILIHRNWCGYTSSYIDITPMVKYGEEVNTIAVRVDADQQEGWWYEGAGIYRHTWLIKRNRVHIATDGVYANPVLVKGLSWQIPAQVTLENTGKENSSITLEMSVFDKQGKLVASRTTQSTVAALGTHTAALTIPVTNPVLWSVDHPELYTVKTRLSTQGMIADEYQSKCGFRTFRFDADSGFYLNGTYLKIHGVCNHQDHAGVGVAVPNALWTFRLQKLKEMGANAYRCAHNPPSVEFLNACDSLGMLVMDENRLFNSSPEYMRQLQWMVRRDRSHPSIILWSVFNEEPMQGSELGYEMVRRMSAEVKKLDTTRPVTAAMNGGLFTNINVSQAVDVVGFNYQIESYDKFHKANPRLPLTSSEDVSGLMVRGEYVTDKDKHLIDAYDTQKPSWGVTHRVAWKAIAERRYLAGCFVWTGFDYRGEPTPYTWPTAGSNFGIMDQCGFPKTAFYLHQAQWITGKPILQLVPHWNWPADSIGKPIKVMALSNAAMVQLFLNGKLISEKPVDKYEMVEWQVPYQPGTLEAIGFTAGKKTATCTVTTTGKAAMLQLTPDRRSINNDGSDAVTITVQALDSAGRPVPTANHLVNFEIKGQGKIIGLGNGDPNSHEAEKGNQRSLFNGLAQLIIQADEGAVSPLTIRATAAGLSYASNVVTINKVAPIPSVPVIQPLLVLDKWRVSPVTSIRPDPNQQLSDNDMNSWFPVKPGQLQHMEEGNFAIFRTSFQPYATEQKNGGILQFKKLTGKAEIWFNGKLIATRPSFEAADFSVPFPAGSTENNMNVLIETMPQQKAGLGGIVTVHPAGW
jgi:beta-galactosidase